MEAMTLGPGPQGSQRSERPPAEEPRTGVFPSRSLILSLAVFVLSFAVLFVGPALALRWITGASGAAGPEEGPGGYSPGVAASAVVTDVVLQQGKPVVINGNPVGPNYAGTKDTYIVRWTPDKNFGNENRLILGQSRAYRPLIRFDLTPAAIPATARVISAQLGLYCYARNVFQSMTAEVYQVVRPWEPAQATWYKATASTLWAIEGCDHPGLDRAPDPATTRSVFDRLVFQYFDVTSIVQNWVTNSSSNQGVLLNGPDPVVIYYYYSSRASDANQRPKLIITYTLEAATPTPTATPTGPTPTPTVTPIVSPVTLDNTSLCYTHTPAVGFWQPGTTGGYGNNYYYESTDVLTATARWAPCSANPIPADGMYDVQAHWSVHSARPQAVPYIIYYDGGTGPVSTTVEVNQTKDALGQAVADFTASGWRSLGVYPFHAGTYTTTGEYVELNTSSLGDTCADAVRWVPRPDVPGPPYTLTLAAVPATLPPDGVATSTLTATVTDRYGHTVADGTMVGFTTTVGTLPYTYTEAESPVVTRLGSGWNEAVDPSASGGKYLWSATFGDELSWTFARGEAVSLVYITAADGGVADVTVDGLFVGTINFASSSVQYKVERVLATALSSGPHTVRVRNGSSGVIRVDAFRSGGSTVGGIANAILIAPLTVSTATVRAVALQSGVSRLSAAWPYTETQVAFPGPVQVWVDDDYCSTCPNGGHRWNFDAFNTIQAGVDKVVSGGTVYVADGTYNESVTINKPLSLLGVGGHSSTLDGVSDAPGSRGFYVDRADNVTISGFKIKNFETGIYLRGTGSGPGPRVENANILNNQFESNNAGSNSYAVRGSYVYSSTLCSNEMTLGYNGIYLDNAYGTTVCYNRIYHNQGFGIKLETANNNSIDNNTIYDNQNVGIELAGATQGNGVFGNVLYDLWWDGILVNGNGTCSVNILANVITATNLAWLNASGIAPDGNHNLGGIVVMGIGSDSSVMDNCISNVSNAQGHRTDAAGILLSGNTGTVSIERNLMRGCTGNGIYLTASGGNPAVHCNSIYSNGRFGFYNGQPAVTVDVTGNWWGRNVPTRGATPPRDIYNGLGVNFSWSPPIALSLSAAPTAIDADGLSTSVITATARGGGCNILDGTWITFSSDLNTLVFPSSAVFANGEANAILRAGTIAGVATITGTAEPGIEGQTVTVTLRALAPASLSIVADPSSVPVGGYHSTVTATVRDTNSNPVPGVTVNFASNALGGVAPTSGTSSATGEVTTTFTSSPVSLGTAVVTATVGTTLSASTNILITAGPVCTNAMTISASPPGIVANGVATSTITTVLTDCVGYPVPDGTMVGFTTTLGTILNYKYVEAESSEVITSTGDWSVLSGLGASGGARIQTDITGAAAYWLFRGEAVSLIYRRAPANGTMRVRVDGGAPMDINTAGSPAAWVEQVIATNLDPVAVHQIEVTHQSGTIALDAFRSGAATVDGRAKAILRAPVLSITDTATIWATSRIGHPTWPKVVVTTTVTFSQTNVVWVDDNYCATCPNDGHIWGNDAFSNIPAGVAAVRSPGTVFVLTGFYTLPVEITKTINLLGISPAGAIIDGGSSVTPAITVTNSAPNAVVSGFTIANWGYGLVIAPSGSGLEVSNNVFTNCSALAISGAWVNSSRILNNEFHGCGTAIDLDTTGNMVVQGNRIQDCSGFGIRLSSSGGSSSGNEVTYNTLERLGDSGIRIGANLVGAQVLSNTVRMTNMTTAAGGGIVLDSSSGTIVEHNIITDISDAGGSTDTSGIRIDGTNDGGNIRYNQILRNVNDGVALVSFNTPPTVNCNHIYANGRFGMINFFATVVDAEGNWWGRNTPTRGTVPPRDIYYDGITANVDYLPRIMLTLTPAAPSVFVGGAPIAVTAWACGGGCCVLDGMPISFTTSLGGLGSPPGPIEYGSMSGGVAVATFTPGTVAGTAVITASMPSAGIVTTTVTILPGIPATISLEAIPTQIAVGVGAGSQSALTASVRDFYGNAVADGTTIYFNTTLGSVAPSATTAGGVALNTLYAGVIPGIAEVRASWGWVVGTAQVEITAGPPYSITALTADPNTLPANGVATSQITAIVRDQYNNFVPDGTLVGFTTTAGSMMYGYVEAESADVIKAGWSAPIADGTASGGYYIQTSTPGAHAYWDFRGAGVSILYRRFASGGRMRVIVDGASPEIVDTSGTPAAWEEWTYPYTLDRGMPHRIEVFCESGTIRLDAFRSGEPTVGGQAVATLTSSLLPPAPVTAYVWAAAVGGTFPRRWVTVQFLQPTEVWVDDNYCQTCQNGGHQWGFDAFSNIPAGVSAVRSGGTVHVLDGVYTTSVTIGKPLFLDGSGSSSTSYLVGSGTGNGIRVTAAADGTTIQGFAIRNFNYGVYLDGSSANPIQGITVTNLAITTCASGAITATYVNNGRIADNALYRNSGFGFDLNTGDNNVIENNHIYDNTGFGLRIFSSASTCNNNSITRNTVHDMGWDGIRIGLGCNNTRVLTNTVYTTNRTNSGGSFDLGGIALYGTSNTYVEGNTVRDVQNGGGSLLDTAGVAVGDGNQSTFIQNNMIRNNANHGIWISASGYPLASPPEIHANSIYCNGRFGIYNNCTAAQAQAQGNWWGRNSPTTGSSGTRDIYTGWGANVLYTPPIRLELTRSPTAIQADGLSIAFITATMRSSGPVYNVLDGTLVTFTASLGTLGAPQVVRSMYNGQTTLLLQAGTVAGRSYITGTTSSCPSPFAASTWVDFVAGPPASMWISATPLSIWTLACAPAGYPVQATVGVTVTDQYGNPCAGRVVDFSACAGFGASVSPVTATLNANGYTSTVLTAGNVAGTCQVAATVDSLSRSVPVEIMSGPPVAMALDRSPLAIPADGVSTAMITATVRDCQSNLIRDGTMVGFVTSRGTLPYAYVEDDNSAMLKSGVGDWTTLYSGSASGGSVIYTDSPGAWVKWTFTGSAVSLVYRRGSTGGSVQVFIDGAPANLPGGGNTLSMWAASTEWQREIVLSNALNPAVSHEVRIECSTGRVWIDALRSGTTTVDGIATAVLTSAPISTTAYITATAVDSRLPALAPGDRPWRETTVRFERSDLRISKRASAATLPAGGLINFTINYTNTGIAQGTNTLITDTLPVSLTYYSSESVPDVGDPTMPLTNVVVWNVGNMQPGTSGVITLTARRVCVPGLGVVTNTVSIGSLTVDAPPAANNQSSASVTLVPGEPFNIRMSADPSSIPVSSQATIYITVTDGCGDAVPSALVYIRTDMGGFDPTATVTTTTRTTDASGQITPTLVFSSGPSCGIATIVATSGSAQGILYVTIGAGLPEHSVVVANPPVIPADGLSTSTISAQVLSNHCPVPDGLFVGFTTSLGSMLYGYAEDSMLVGNQSPPSSWTTEYDASASGGSYLSTTLDGASIYWDFYGNGVSVVYRKTGTAGTADVSIDGSLMEHINMNSGGGTVWRAEKVYTLPGSSTASHRIVISHRAGTGPIFLDAFRSGVKTLGGQAVAMLTSATTPGMATVAATVVSETADIPALIPGFVNVRFDPADLTVTKTVQPTGAITIGQRITYTITYRNDGPATATAASLDDALSLDGLRDMWFSTQPMTVTPYTHYYWSLGSLAAGQSGSISFGGRIDTGRYWPSATVLTNTVVASSRTFDGSGANNTSTVTNTIVPERPASISLSASPGSIPVGGSISTLTAEVRDMYGNPVPNGTPVTFTTNLGGFPVAAQYVGSTSSGAATASLASSNSAGSATVVARVDSLTASTQVVFTPGNPFTMTVTATPSEITVGGATSIIDAWIRDQYGNWVADGTAVSFATSAGTIAPTAVGTFGGHASSVLTSGNVAVTATVTVTAAPISGTVQVRFRAGTPLVQMVAVPSSLRVGETSTITLTARDVLLNPVSDETVTFTTTLGDFGGYTTVTRTTDANGRASVPLRSTAVGQALVRGQIRNETAAVIVTFNPGDPCTITLTVDPSVIVGCGGTGMARAEVRDCYSNTVRDGTVVVFSISPQGEVRPLDGGRTTNGVARAIVASGTVPGPATVWAWPEAWRTQIVTRYPVEFLVGPPDTLDLQALPMNLQVGGNRGTIQLRALDCGGYAVQNGTPVTFTIVTGEGTLSPQYTTTSNGWAYSTLTSPDETGSATIRAEIGDRQATVVVQYIPGPPYNIIVDAVPAAIAADGVSTSTIGAEVRDRYGNYVVNNTLVEFTTDRGRFETGSSYRAYTQGGRASAVLTSDTTFGRARVVARSQGRQGETYVDFYFVPTPTPSPTLTPTPRREWRVHLPVILKNRWR